MIAGIIIKITLIILILVILYLLAIMPRMIRKPNKAPFMGVLYAHRGLHDNQTQAPENSMAAFAGAVEAGYGIELDVQLSRDGIPIVFHDNTLNRMCGVEGKPSDYTYEELQAFPLLETQERIPRLQEVLELVGGKVPLIVEFKIEWRDVSVCVAADALLREYQGTYCIESFNPMALLWYRRNNNRIMRGQLSDAFFREKIYAGGLYVILQGMLLNFMTKPDFIAYNHKHADILSRCICRNLYRNLSVAWTVQSEEELTLARKNFDLFIFDSFLPEKEE